MEFMLQVCPQWSKLTMPPGICQLARKAKGAATRPGLWNQVTRIRNPGLCYEVDGHEAVRRGVAGILREKGLGSHEQRAI